MRAHLEHDPRNPFAVGVCDVLDTLAATWGGIYDVAFANGRWRAQRRDRKGLVLTCETPDELVRAMRGCGGTT